jgi:hypothetical protein
MEQKPGWIITKSRIVGRLAGVRMDSSGLEGGHNTMADKGSVECCWRQVILRFNRRYLWFNVLSYGLI